MASAKPHFRLTAGGDVLPSVRAADGLRNVVTNIGTARDKSTHSEYVYSDLAAEQARNAYRGSWIPRKIVNIPAQDATRRWRAWDADKAAITKLEAEERRLSLRLKVKSAMRTARLFGGGAIFIGTDQSPEDALDVNALGAGGLRYLTVLDRRDLVPDLIVLDIASEFFGLPEYYDIATSSAGSNMKVHASRLAIFQGAELPDTGAARQHPWGDSVLQAPWKALKDTDATMANLAQLVFEAKVDTIGIPGMTQKLASDPRAEQQIIDRISLLQSGKSIANAIVHDTEEVIDQKTIQFGKMPEIMDRFFQIVAGAADIPATRFFGQAPAGMNSTGESDMRNYYDHVQEMQESSVQPSLANLDEALIVSALGNRPPAIHYNWRSLWQTTEKERAEIGKTIVETGKGLVGILPPEVVADATANALIESEAMPGIEAAVDEHGVGVFDDDDDNDLELQGALAANDAEPRTLYVSRKVTNADEIIAWAKEQGFKDTLSAEDLHVTVAYSRKAVDWMKAGATWDDKIEMPAGGPRLMDEYGKARVLLIASSHLSWRHEDIKRESGATWDHGEYQPHITISYSDDSPNLDDVEPYRGPINLGPEIFEEIKEGWAEGLD